MLKFVTDQNGIRYELSERLGQGGQGSVYAVKGGRLAVKLIMGGDQLRRDRLRNQITHVRRLPLRDLALAKPLEMLRPPHTGYVMEMLTGMGPIKSLMNPPKGESSLAKWYLESGGLRRRLRLLGKAAHLLAQLHGKGLVYSDPSPENIFISLTKDDNEVWLIDTDNLQYEANPANCVFTPGFGAPELIKRTSGATSLSDAFAFAVLAFQTLTLAHPFIGDMVDAGEPELEEQAYAGLLPWIDDPNDNRNRSSFGVPRTTVLSQRLVDSFWQAFGPGRANPCARPSLSEWAERLFAAADGTIVCPGCSGTYFFNQSVCPWCNTDRPEFATIVFHLWDPGFGAEGGIAMKPKGESKQPVLMGYGAVTNNQTFIITRRLAFGSLIGQIDHPVVSVTLVDDCVKLKSLDGNRYSLLTKTGGHKSELSDREKSIKLEKGRSAWQLHFVDSKELHRVALFELRGGARA